MKPMTTMLRGVTSVVLGASVLLSLAGCPKKSTDSATKDDEKSKKTKVEGYTRGEVLKHVPAKCRVARLYMDLAAIREVEGVGNNLDAFQQNAIDGAGSSDGKKVKKALKALEKEGIDPKKDLQELAICVDDDKSVTVAIGGAVKGKDSLGALQKAAEGLGAEDLEKKKKKGVEYLRVDKDVVMGMVSDTVLVVTMDEDQLAAVKDENDVSGDWELADGRLVSGFFARKKGGEKDLDVSGSLDKDGDDLVLSVTAKAKSDEAKKALEDDAPKVKKELKSMIEAVADGAEKVGNGIAEDIRGAKVSVEGSTIKGKMTVKGKNLSKALDKLSKMDESELEGLFK